eukprot:151942-Chlamydomonas_euryale.AAC.1
MWHSPEGVRRPVTSTKTPKLSTRRTLPPTICPGCVNEEEGKKRGEKRGGGERGPKKERRGGRRAGGRHGDRWRER